MIDAVQVELQFMGTQPDKSARRSALENSEIRSSMQSIIELDTRRSMLENTELERQIRKSIWGAYFNATIPPFLTQLASAALLFINGFVVARILGTIGLSSQTYSAPMDYMVRGCAQIFASGCVAVLSSLIGSNAEKDVRDLVPSSLFWALIVLSAILIGVLSAILRPIYRFLGGEGAILQGAIEYSQGLIYILPCYMFYMVFSSTLLAEGLSRLNMAISILTTVLSAVFTFVFVQYTSWGVQAAAYGNGLALGIGAVLCFSLYFTRYTVTKIRFSLVLSYRRETCLLLWRMFIIGLGNALIYLAYSVIMSLFNYLINRALKDSGYLDLGLSAAGGISRVYAIFTAVYLSFGSLGYLPIASFFVGQRNSEKLLSLSNRVGLLIVVLCGILTVLVITLQNYIGGLFSQEPKFAELFKYSVYWSYSTAILAAFQFLAIAFGQCLGMVKRVMITSILCLGIYQPLGMLLFFYTVGGYYSIMISYCFNDVISFITCVAMMWYPYRHIDAYIDQFLYDLNKTQRSNTLTVHQKHAAQVTQPMLAAKEFELQAISARAAAEGGPRVGSVILSPEDDLGDQSAKRQSLLENKF